MSQQVDTINQQQGASADERKKIKVSMFRFSWSWLSIPALLVFWISVATYLDYSRQVEVIPQPLEVWNEFKSMSTPIEGEKIQYDHMSLGQNDGVLRQSWWTMGSLGPHIWQSFKEVTVGFGIAFIVALMLGFMAGFYRGFREFITPLNGIFMSIPAIAWAPMLVLIFDNQFLAIILVVYIAAVSPMIIAIMEGVLTITGQEVRAARALGAKRNQLFVYVYLPASLPFITAGLRIGFSQAWRALVAAEMVGGIGRGLGHMVNLSDEVGSARAMMLGIVLIGLLSYVFERLIFRRIERHYEVWRLH